MQGVTSFCVTAADGGTAARSGWKRMSVRVLATTESPLPKVGWVGLGKANSPLGGCFGPERLRCN
jgi:hypothetical protein